MKKLFLFIVFAVASSVYATKFNITIVNDHTNLLYKCGEEALFNIVAILRNLLIVDEQENDVQ